MMFIRVFELLNPERVKLEGRVWIQRRKGGEESDSSALLRMVHPDV